MFPLRTDQSTINQRFPLFCPHNGLWSMKHGNRKQSTLVCMGFFMDSFEFKCLVELHCHIKMFAFIQLLPTLSVL
jgi:hypothetical protein